jgi:hypothetical protein
VAILVLRFFEGGLSTPESLEIAMFSTVGAIGFFLFIMLLNLWYVPHTCRRLFDQQPAASNPYEFTFNAEGLKTVGRFESNDLPWSHILGWLENDRLIILSKANVTFFCLPKAQLGQTNLSALKQCLSAAGVKKGL